MSILVNRELIRRMIDQGEPLQPFVNRAVGKTTTAVLGAIAASHAKPGAVGGLVAHAWGTS